MVAVHTEFVVTAAEILDECVPGTDRSCLAVIAEQEAQARGELADVMAAALLRVFDKDHRRTQRGLARSRNGHLAGFGLTGRESSSCVRAVGRWRHGRP